MNWQSIKAHLSGALRSFTVWFAAILMAAPDALSLVQANFPTLAPFIPDALESRVINVIALLILLLRVKTTVSLAEKGAAKPDPVGQQSGV